MKTRTIRDKSRTAQSRTRDEKSFLMYFSVHIVSRHRLEFILSKKFRCTKTGFQRCAMQITIAIKGALSSVRAHSSLLNFQSEQCISPGHTVSRHRLEFIVSKKFQCTKTGFQRCSMQITIAIKVPYRRLGHALEQIADDTKRIADGTKQIADGTKQNKKRQKVYAVPRGSQFCKSGLGILRKGEVIP
ncbi:hypothetical protein T01_5446, partial [Trichinella spiralis]